MNRRELFQLMPALAAASQLQGQSATKCRLRSGLVAYSFRKQFDAKTMTYETLVRYVADVGLDGIDLTAYWFPDTSDQTLASLHRTAYKHAVHIYSLAARVRLCQPTADLQRAEVENAKKWLDVAQKLGAGHMRVFGGSVPKGTPEPQAVAWATEVLKRAAEYAATKGVIIGIEDDGGLSTTAEQTVTLAKAADSPWVGINLDTGNFPKNGYESVAMCMPYAVSTHIKTKIATADGTKEKADWDRLIGMFAKAGYNGYVSLEYEDTVPPEQAIPGLAAELRRLVRKYS